MIILLIKNIENIHMISLKTSIGVLKKYIIMSITILEIKNKTLIMRKLYILLKKENAKLNTLKKI